MKYFKQDGTSYNWERSKGESVSDILGIDIKTLDDGGFQFYQTGLIQKVLEDTGMWHCNGFPTATTVEAPLRIDENGYKDKIYWTNSYASVIGTILYLASNTKPVIYFAVHQCFWYTHNTKLSHETAVKRPYVGISKIQSIRIRF